MLSFRQAARSAPRTFSRLSATAFRRPAAIRPSALTRLAQGTILRPRQAPAFSTSALRWAPNGEADEELSAKIESELQFEEEAAQDEQLPASVSDFIANSPFEIEDVAGREDVKLTRTFGDEKITVTFSVADLNQFDPYEEDRAMADEDFDPSDPSADPTKAGSRAADDAAAEEYDEANAGEEDEAAPPCHLTVVVEKPGKQAGALAVLASAQDGALVVDNMFYFDEAADAHAMVGRRGNTAEEDLAASKSGAKYLGPSFGTLDEDLQMLVERFLEERGVTQALAVFVPDYLDVKEQREYVRWLNNVKGFIDA